MMKRGYGRGRLISTALEMVEFINQSGLSGVDSLALDRRFNCNRKTTRRWIAAMEELGLIEVDREPGRLMLVRLMKNQPKEKFKKEKFDGRQGL